MSNDDDRPPPSSQTIQVDALSDVELVDHRHVDGDDEGASPAPAMSLPPPLPRKAPPPAAPPRTSTARMALQLLAVVVVTGGLGAIGAHFLAPAAPVAPAPAAAPAVVEPEVNHPEVNHIVLDDEFVIRAEPDTGLAAAE